ncbi:uncharacterized protein [Mytilus edulis]|uniref:uncharacterized protein n=1 Tax=Mytilus edulis TaxID=6550 RepID=UPI0039EE634E
MESLQNSNADMKENIERLCRLQTEGSKRQRLIGETSAELDHHRKDQTYTEIKAVTACLQMLDNSKVLILSGREGSGKSKNSLEILRRIKEKHPETDVIKLKRLTQFSDIIKEDAVTVVLFEDVFGRITKQFCENTDEPILDSLHSYIKLGNVKVIFVICNTVKQECQSLLSSHDIFYNNIAYLDLNSEEFELSYKEKESILVNYCTKNEIDIIYKDDSFNHNDRNIDKIKVSSIDKPDVSCRMSADNKCLVINCSAIEEMISSDPYQGFPECCRLFTRNKNITKLGATYFRYPLKSLLKEIESMRMEGKANDVKGLKYVILLYILLNQAQSAGSLQTESHDRVLMSINENGIDVLAHQTLFKECYSRNIGLNVHDIMYLCEELTCRYLTRKENTIYFQHRTFQDSVLISYCKINPKAIIPLLSIDHMVDIVRPQNYMEQEEEIFIKIPTIYYPELAVKIISFFYSDQRYANVKHDMIDMTELFMNVCCSSYNEEKHAIDCMMDNVDHSLIDYDKCIDEMLGLGALVQLVENLFKQWDDYDEDGQYYYKDIETFFRLLLKYHSDNIGVAEMIMEKACNVGSHRIVEELLLDKFDNISYYLNRTLDKCLSQGLDKIFVSNNGGYGKLLMLFIQRVNIKFIDLDSLMNDVCNIGHTSAVLWLLENNYSHCFDLRNVLNKASYHGDLELVKYLQQTYKTGDFDYKTAMVKACQNSQNKMLDVCKWLWANTDRDWFDMKVALNNASRYDNTTVVEWILTDVDTELFDTEDALFCACEHGSYNTVKLLLETSGINIFDFQYAITVACRNENNGYTIIAKLLYERADKSTINIHAVFSVACKNYRSDIVQWIIETCDQNISFTETRDGNKDSTKSLDKNLVDMDQALTCIINMVASDSHKENHNETKKKLVWLILNQCDPKAIYIFELLTETCKNDWIEIFQWILRKVDNSGLNIGEVINEACQNGAFKIVKWSLENINIQLLDADNVMIESCGSGWLECLVLIQKHCNQYNLHAAMLEACTYGRLDIVKWLLQNYNYKYFNLPLLLKETARNGWTHIFSRLITHFQFYNSDLQFATKEALINGNQRIIKLMLLVVGRDALDLSTPLIEELADTETEIVVNFILRNFDLRRLDLSKIMTNACKFGWQNIASFIINNDSNCLCDSALGLIDISSFITGKHVNCLCDFTSAFNTACMNGEAEIVQLLIVNVSHKIFAVQKAMLSTCIKGWDEIAVLLLDNFEHTQLDICNALIEACRHGEIYVVQAILRKIKHNLFDIKTALNEACENHMNEDLVLWILKNIDHEQLDLTNVRRKAVRHNWRTVQLEMPEVDIEDLNQIEHETETDYIVIP